MLGMPKNFKQQIQGGRADKSLPSDFDAKELSMGKKVELEHTKDKVLAEEIAMDHLKEFPGYYTALKQMESDLEKKSAHEDEEGKEAEGFTTDIEKKTIENDKFRDVLETAPKSQLVAMSLKPGEDIGSEVHDGDQFFRFEKGDGEIKINDKKTPVTDGSAAVVPEGAEHNVTNTSKDKDLKLYAVYSPPQHPADQQNQNKPTEAENKAEEEKMYDPNVDYEKEIKDYLKNDTTPSDDEFHEHSKEKKMSNHKAEDKVYQMLRDQMFGKEAREHFAYRNIHKGKGSDNHHFSMRSKDTGRVEHRGQNFIMRNATFKVSEKGNQRVRDEKRKNVHAGVQGTLYKGKKAKDLEWEKVQYNPYTHKFFQDADGNKLLGADFVKFTPNGVMVPTDRSLTKTANPVDVEWAIQLLKQYAITPAFVGRRLYNQFGNAAQAVSHSAPVNEIVNKVTPGMKKLENAAKDAVEEAVDTALEATGQDNNDNNLQNIAEDVLSKSAEFKSKAQRRKFYALKAEGKMDQKTIDEWEADTKNKKKLPERLKKTAKELTSLGRKHVKDSNFVFPKEKRYPIHDISHARNALARVSQHGTEAEKAKVRAAVHKKYPSIEKTSAPRWVKEWLKNDKLFGKALKTGLDSDNIDFLKKTKALNPKGISKEHYLRSVGSKGVTGRDALNKAEDKGIHRFLQSNENKFKDSRGNIQRKLNKKQPYDYVGAPKDSYAKSVLKMKDSGKLEGMVSQEIRKQNERLDSLGKKLKSHKQTPKFQKKSNDMSQYKDIMAALAAAGLGLGTAGGIKRLTYGKDPQNPWADKAILAGGVMTTPYFMMQAIEDMSKTAGGPGSGVQGDNTEFIDMPLTPYITIMKRTTFMNSKKPFIKNKTIKMKDIKYVGQKKFVPKKLKKMCDALKKGELWPKEKAIDVTVDKSGDYAVLDGHHRFLALRDCGEKTIKANVYTVSEKDKTEEPLEKVAINLNVGRFLKKLHPALARMPEALKGASRGGTLAEHAKNLGKGMYNLALGGKTVGGKWDPLFGLKSMGRAKQIHTEGPLKGMFKYDNAGEAMLKEGPRDWKGFMMDEVRGASPSRADLMAKEIAKKKKMNVGDYMNQIGSKQAQRLQDVNRMSVGEFMKRYPKLATNYYGRNAIQKGLVLGFPAMSLYDLASGKSHAMDPNSSRLGNTLGGLAETAGWAMTGPLGLLGATGAVMGAKSGAKALGNAISSPQKPQNLDFSLPTGRGSYMYDKITGHPPALINPVSYY